MRHREHLELEIQLGKTFLAMGCMEVQLGEAAGAARSFQHARVALRGARKGILRITDFATGERDQFRARIAAIEALMPEAV